MSDFYGAAQYSGNAPEALAEVQRSCPAMRSEKGLAPKRTTKPKR
jgi:hypothetical protein